MSRAGTREAAPTAHYTASGATVAAYGVLGLVLCATRLVGLDRSLWHDEVLTVLHFVREGPREILSGLYLPNNHELFSVLGWATTSIAGETESVLRFWSVIPFLVGVALVTAWAHVRMGAATGVLYLFFATLSPLLLDLSRQARGYGLAFLAMSVLVVATYEADRRGHRGALVVALAAGVVGTWTLPIFGLAFLGTCGALFLNPMLRSKTALGLGLSAFAILAWYAPHLDDILKNSEQEFGAPIRWERLATAPIDQILVPALLWTEGLALTPNLLWLPLIAAIALLLASSPLLREPRTAVILGSGMLLTFVVVWATQLFLAPRFVSYLLVPLFLFLASGIASVLARISTDPPLVRLVVAILVPALVVVQFAGAAARVLRLPREAHKNVAEAIASRVPESTPVLAYVLRSEGLEYYLGRPVQLLRESEVARTVCEQDREIVYVAQPFRLSPVEVPCLDRSGVEHLRFRQYDRGGETDIWIVPSHP